MPDSQNHFSLCIKLVVCTAISYVLLVITPPSSFGEVEAGSQQCIRSLFAKYHPQPDEQKELVTLSRSDDFPGALVGNVSLQKMTYFHQNWRFRRASYEMLFTKADSMCPIIYGLAIYSKDIRPDVPLSRFSAGVQGFHYAIGQVTDWLNAVNLGTFKRYEESESFLERRLLDDGVIRIDNGKYSATGSVRHIVGAAPGKKRTLLNNLTHERFHIIWDEDDSFRATWLSRWHAMSEGEKGCILQSFEKKGYAVESEEGIAEEWAVRSSDLCDIEQYESCTTH